MLHQNNSPHLLGEDICSYLMSKYLYFPSILGGISISMMKVDDHKASWGGEALFGFYIDVIIEGSQDRNQSRAGNWKQKLV